MERLLHDALDAGAMGFSTSQAPTHNDGDGNPVPSRAATRDELVRLAGAVRSHPGHAARADHRRLPQRLLRRRGRPHDRDVARRRPPAQLERARRHAGRHAREAARRRHARRGAGRARRRAHAAARACRSACRSSPASCSTACPAGARRSRCRSPSGIRALSDPDGARPPRRAGALARGRRAREPRALGAARSDRDVHAARRRRSRAARIGDIAKEQGKAPFDALLDIVIADELRTGLRPNFGGPEPDETWKMRVDVWRDPRAMIGGSDAGAHLDMMCGASYSTFVVGDAVRNGYLSLEEAVHLSPTSPRGSTGSRDRGRIAEGAFADLVCFDPDDRRPDRRAHLRRPARRREPHRRRVAGRRARARERHRDRPRLRVHRRDPRHACCGPDATPTPSTQHPRRLT